MPPPPQPTSTHQRPAHHALFPPPPSAALIAAQSTAPPATGHLSKLSFPRFDGDNPPNWQSLCADYFEMYIVLSAMWIRVAKQHLDKAAARWFQCIEPGLYFSDWQNFCHLLHDRFDRDQKELLIRQLFQAKQTTSVAEYITQFTKLVDQLKAYSQSTDPMFYTMRFIDRLRADIEAIVLVLHPKDLDTACTVALLKGEGRLCCPAAPQSI
jgi:hypothetical protein